MQLLGIGLNIEHKVVICSTCYIVITPRVLYSHFWTILKKHHTPKDFQLGQRLAFFTQEFCTKFIKDHQLKEIESPETTIQAIPSLTVCLEMMACSHCGYAAGVKETLQKHLKVCTQGQILKGPAQTFQNSKTKGFFRVTLPPPSNPNPLDAALLSHQQSASNPYAAVPIQASHHPQELVIFLAQENWLGEVDGMTGQEITELARKAQLNLKEKVKESVLCYALSTVTKLQSTESAVRLTMGDYNRWIVSHFPLVTEPLELKLSI